MLVFLMSLKGLYAAAPVEMAVHLLTALVACLIAGIFTTIYFSPRERAWRKWRRRMRRKYGSVEV